LGIKRRDNIWRRDVSGCSTSDRGKMGKHRGAY
jgi:hypothetical protein